MPLGCENNDKCRCDLSLSQESADTAITVGKDSEIEMSVRIVNSGSEPAYNAKLLVIADQIITVRIGSRKCLDSSKSFESQVAYLMEKCQKYLSLNLHDYTNFPNAQLTRSIFL